MKRSKRSLRNQLNKLKMEYRRWEAMQTDFSCDADFYDYCQKEMDALDEKAEQIRYSLEMGCCEK